MIKKVSFLIITLLCFFRWGVAAAGPLDDYYEARKLYIFAAACRAAYDDRLGQVALDALADNGWQIQKYKKVGDKADARLLLAHNDLTGDGKRVYLLAATGTETLKDVLTDLTVDRVFFYGHTPEELIANAENREAPPHTPMVHRGFYNYVRTALTIEAPQGKGHDKGLLFDAVTGDPDRKIYLVGHSLGGAAVTVSAAALINFGARPEQLAVVTFGAPAVGNEAFRAEYEARLDLTRYVIRGDIVTGILQGLGGYSQFGREVNWSGPATYTNEPHDMALYLDHAIKNYYDKRQLAIEAGVLSAPTRVLPGDRQIPFVYVSPMVNSMPESLRDEFFYMKEALYGEYRDLFPAYIFAAGEGQADSVAAALRAAVAAGCQWLVVPEFQGRMLKNERHGYQIIFQQTVYRVKDGAVVSLETYSSGTHILTPLEAAIHGAIAMSAKKAPWLKGN